MGLTLAGAACFLLRTKMTIAKDLALIIEDDVASAEALAFLLRDWGADVIVANSADAVRRLVPAPTPRLRWVITDFHLGDGPDGVSIVTDLIRAAPHLRVLLLSGSFHGRAAVAGAAAGIETMQKPARAEGIIAWLERG
jgi:ActR/RegA family two-component response regulator